jgi:hypothetical protein
LSAVAQNVLLSIVSKVFTFDQISPHHKSDNAKQESRLQPFHGEAAPIINQQV